MKKPGEVILDDVPTFFDEETIKAIRVWGMAIGNAFDDHIDFFLSEVLIKVL